MNKLGGFLNRSRNQWTLVKNYSFKSDLSLDKIYPNCSKTLFTPPPPPSKDGKFSGFIPMDQIEITYSRSTGPGGQNVNRVNTKVDLRFNVSKVSFISQEVKDRLMQEYKNQITKDGYFVIKSDVTRSQLMNQADALEKVRIIIRRLEKLNEPVVLSPETLEKIRRRKEKAARERLQEKRERSAIKAAREPPTL